MSLSKCETSEVSGGCQVAAISERRVPGSPPKFQRSLGLGELDLRSHPGGPLLRCTACSFVNRREHRG